MFSSQCHDCRYVITAAIFILLNYFEFRNAICLELSTLACNYLIESLCCMLDN